MRTKLKPILLAMCFLSTKAIAASIPQLNYKVTPNGTIASGTIVLSGEWEDVDYLRTHIRAPDEISTVGANAFIPEYAYEEEVRIHNIGSTYVVEVIVPSPLGITTPGDIVLLVDGKIVDFPIPLGKDKGVSYGVVIGVVPQDVIDAWDQEYERAKILAKEAKEEREGLGGKERKAKEKKQERPRSVAHVRQVPVPTSEGMDPFVAIFYAAASINRRDEPIAPSCARPGVVIQGKGHSGTSPRSSHGSKSKKDDTRKRTRAPKSKERKDMHRKKTRADRSRPKAINKKIKVGVSATDVFPHHPLRVGSKYKVKRGDMLMTIATRLVTPFRATLDQKAWAIFRRNPHAFYRNNPNALIVGSVLDLGITRKELIPPYKASKLIDEAFDYYMKHKEEFAKQTEFERKRREVK